MFCQNCGSQMPDNAKFCGNCGAVNALYEQEKTESAQPVQQTSAIPTPVQSNYNVQPVQSSIPAQANASAQNAQAGAAAGNQGFYQPAQPVQQASAIPVPVQSDYAAQPVQPTIPAQANASVQNAQAGAAAGNPGFYQPSQQAQQNPTDALMNEYYRAASTQNSTPDTGYQQPVSEPQPMRYTEAVNAVAPIKKKKSKLIPGLCIAAGGVVVLGGAAFAVYNCNKANVSHLMMGDANYAYSVAASALSGIGEQSNVLNTAVQNSMTSGMSGTSAGDLLESAGFGGSYGSSSSGSGFSSGSSDELNSMGNAMEFVAGYLNELTGTNGVAVTVSGSAELDPSVVEMAKVLAESGGIDGEIIENLLDGVDSVKFSVAEKDSGSAYEYSTKLTVGNDSVIEAQMRYEEDGTFTMVFPGISDTGLTAQLPAHSSDKIQMNIPVDYDFSELYSNIGDELKKAFENFDIECGNGTAEFNGLKFSGMIVEISLDKDDICDIGQVVVDVLSDDESFAEYLKSLDSSTSDEYIEYIFENLSDTIDSMRTSSAEFSSDLTFYVNNDNTVAGARLEVKSGDENAVFEAISVGNDCEISASISGTEYLAVHIKGTSANSGRAELVIGGLDSTSNSYENSIMDIDGINSGKFSIYLDYKDVGTANVFGTPTAVGSYTISLSSEAARVMSDGNSEIQYILSNSKVTVSAVPTGKGISYTLGANIVGYVKGEITIALEEAFGEVAPKPGSNYKLVDIETADEDIVQLGEDFMRYFEELAGKNKFIGAVYELIVASQESVNDQLNYDNYYDDYYNDYYNDYYDDYYDYLDDYLNEYYDGYDYSA